MELWVDAIFIVIVALLIDRFIGEVPNAIHPLRWMGNILGWLDRRVKNRASGWAHLWGLLSYLLVFCIFWFISITVCMLVRVKLGDWTSEIGNYTVCWGEILWIILCGFFFKISFAVFSFRKHCMPIQKDLREGNTEAAAAKVQMIVSRKTKGMDAEHIASSCCETVSENLVDSVCSPTFYFGLLGLTGSVMFRCCNLMDAMWGYLNDKYRNLGFFPAKFDDVLGFITSRVSPVFVWLAAKLMRMPPHPGIIEAARRDHAMTPSPNSGWPMTAVAAALGISMEKKDVYIMGAGSPMPTIDDVTRCYHLVELTSILFIIIVTIPLFVFIGIHVEIFAEDLIRGLFGGLI
ncbi:MAG: adenosylcobinamide-phosphate synthase CbiB [Candidatus Methanomethylophilaceae archaeon]|nr:adenosylcobinamide-phosphate synthase CbiB [Candidatus Methanomethylophilaceae archaeon]MDD3379022.1 adenosylcobinamide-phosphate synthase CbiB [Candidatus Methanomethylophilaceae archaeon]